MEDKTTGAGFPHPPNSSVPLPEHSSESTDGEKHVDMQSRDEDGKVTVHPEGKHLTDEGHRSWGRQAHGQDEV
jgi:hypothetical protein